MTAKEISRELEKRFGYYDIFVPEFEYGNLRIDAILIDTKRRQIRGFEIKVNRNDYLSDEKWPLYEQFCSSLAIVCPDGLIQPEEIPDPYGLLWVSEKRMIWKKRAKNFQKMCPAWFWLYTKILETEFRRIAIELDAVKRKELEKAVEN